VDGHAAHRCAIEGAEVCFITGQQYGVLPMNGSGQHGAIVLRK